MAVMQQSITFGGVNSADFDLYIGGEGTFNAPKRSVEIVDVPGRNGAIVIDKGHFENIEVTYTVINQEDNLATFSQKLSDFRNALCAQRGYQRLSDTFHPDEFRLALFVDDFEVKPIEYANASEFQITFNCKPQRYLVSGETPVVVANGDTLTNPTLFDAEPLLAIKGSGLVKFNGYEINLINPYRGETVIAEPMMEQYGPLPYEVVTVAADLKDVANVGDTITVKPVTIMWDILLPHYLPYTDDESIGTITIQETSTKTTIMGRDPNPEGVAYVVHMRTVIDEFEITSWPTGTDAEQTFEVGLTINYRHGGAYTVTGSVYFPISYTYDETAGEMTFTFERIKDSDENVQYIDPMYTRPISLSTQGMSVDSTVYLLGDPTYLDCELGEAYKIESGEVVSLNQHIDMGSRLPKLVPGDTEFEVTGNITEVKVTPRWWKL